MEHSLLCPMQLRENDVILDECPKSMIENPTEVNHSLLVITETNYHLQIHLQLRGVTSTIYVTKPTVQDLDRYEQIELTNRDLLWNPQNPDFAANENSFLNAFGEFITETISNGFILQAQKCVEQLSKVDSFLYQSFGSAFVYFSFIQRENVLVFT